MNASRLHLVSCVGQKLASPSRAEDLYVSPWFKKARKFVELQETLWLILSAKYGLVAPSETIEPYELTLNTMKVADRKAWTARVTDQLKPLVQPETTIVILAGSRYRQYLVPWLVEEGCDVEIPMEGLGIGEQLSWLNRQLEERESAA